MDSIDKRIIELLSKNAAISSAEISKEVNLSVPAVNKRIQKLEKEVIERFTILTDRKALMKNVVAFVLIVMRYGDGVEKFLSYVDEDKDILECHALTGEYDYLIKICARDVEGLEDKLLDLKKQKGVVKSYTMLSLMEHKFNPSVLP